MRNLLQSTLTDLEISQFRNRSLVDVYAEDSLRHCKALSKSGSRENPNKPLEEKIRPKLQRSMLQPAIYIELEIGLLVWTPSTITNDDLQHPVLISELSWARRFLPAGHTSRSRKGVSGRHTPKYSASWACRSSGRYQPAAALSWALQPHPGRGSRPWLSCLGPEGVCTWCAPVCQSS